MSVVLIDLLMWISQANKMQILTMFLHFLHRRLRHVITHGRVGPLVRWDMFSAAQHDTAVIRQN